jgi:hypothetical protein
LVMFIPTRADMDIVATAKMFFNHWYGWFGLPKKIRSDRDGRFISKFWKKTLPTHAEAAGNVYKPPPSDRWTNRESK